MTEETNTRRIMSPIRKTILTCAYCTTDYKWINHKHTQGFFEHPINKDDEPPLNKGERCRFIGHRVLNYKEK